MWDIKRSGPEILQRTIPEFSMRDLKNHARHVRFEVLIEVLLRFHVL
jgi:hypothetical protein